MEQATLNNQTRPSGGFFIATLNNGIDTTQ